MKEFPDKLRPENKDKFHSYLYNRNLAYLRKEIFENILHGDENNYFILGNFYNKNGISSEDSSKMTETIMTELNNLGWKTSLSFNNTGLFIYSTDKPPRSCYVDEF